MVRSKPMFDAYIRAVSADDLSALEEALALLEAEIDQVAASLVWQDLRAMAARRPSKVVETLAELVQEGALEGLCLYIDGRPAGVCFWGVDEDEADAPDAARGLVCLLVAERYEKRGLEKWLLAEANLSRETVKAGKAGSGGAARNVRA